MGRKYSRMSTINSGLFVNGWLCFILLLSSCLIYKTFTENTHTSMLEKQKVLFKNSASPKWKLTTLFLSGFPSSHWLGWFSNHNSLFCIVLTWPCFCLPLLIMRPEALHSSQSLETYVYHLINIYVLEELNWVTSILLALPVCM